MRSIQSSPGRTEVQPASGAVLASGGPVTRSRTELKATGPSWLRACESRSSPCGNSFSFQIIFVSMDRVMRFSSYEPHAGWEKSCPTRTEMRQMGRS